MSGRARRDGILLPLTSTSYAPGSIIPSTFDARAMAAHLRVRRRRHRDRGPPRRCASTGCDRCPRSRIDVEHVCARTVLRIGAAAAWIAAPSGRSRRHRLRHDVVAVGRMGSPWRLPTAIAPGASCGLQRPPLRTGGRGCVVPPAGRRQRPAAGRTIRPSVRRTPSRGSRFVIDAVRDPRRAGPPPASDAEQLRCAICCASIRLVEQLPEPEVRSISHSSPRRNGEVIHSRLVGVGPIHSPSPSSPVTRTEHRGVLKTRADMARDRACSELRLAGAALRRTGGPTGSDRRRGRSSSAFTAPGCRRPFGRNASASRLSRLSFHC